MIIFNFYRFLRLRLLWIIGLLLFPALLHAAGIILVLGDSLSAGYGIPVERAWPSLLEKQLTEKRLDYKVINESVSGETTEGGLARLEALIEEHQPQIVIIALGSNDGLRRYAIDSISDNLKAMIKMAQENHAQVLLVGNRMPPTYGKYAADFHALYPTIAKATKVKHVDFLLDGVALKSKYLLDDRIHPNAAAQPILLDNVWQELKRMLR